MMMLLTSCGIDQMCCYEPLELKEVTPAILNLWTSKDQMDQSFKMLNNEVMKLWTSRERILFECPVKKKWLN
jgi:hypothetical protein